MCSVLFVRCALCPVDCSLCSMLCTVCVLCRVCAEQQANMCWSDVSSIGGTALGPPPHGTVHRKQCIACYHSAKCTVQYTVQNVHFTMHSAQCTSHSWQCHMARGRTVHREPLWPLAGHWPWTQVQTKVLETISKSRFQLSANKGMVYLA